jgi:FAD/FMN-containing dehydrogenase
VTGNLSRRAVLGLVAASAVGALTGGASGPTGSAAGSIARRGGGGPDWDSLRRHLDGDLILPSDPRYGQAREQSLAQFDNTNPVAVAYCESAKDVRTAIAFAQNHDVHAVPRSGGHSFGGYSTTTGMILDVSRLNQVAIHGEHVTIGAGTQQVDALAALTPHGLALASGLCPTVGAGGYIQGGGIGLQTRKFGMACDRLVSAEVVLADGRVVRASARAHPDLFWALRGNGGGNYGVVTSYTLRPVERDTLVGYRLIWLGDAAAVIEKWQDWVIAAPSDLSSLLLTRVRNPPTPETVVIISGAWYGAIEDLNLLVDQLVGEVGVTPRTRVVAASSVRDTMMAVYGCATLTVAQCHRAGTSPDAQVPRAYHYHTRSRMYDAAVPRADVDDLVAVLTDPAKSTPAQDRLLYFEALGGAANQPARTDTAYVHRTTKMLTGVTAQLIDANYTADDVALGESWLADGFAVLDRHSLRESYQNYMDPALEDWRRDYYAENYPRLVRVKRAYDPHGFFRFARGIG